MAALLAACLIRGETPARAARAARMSAKRAGAARGWRSRSGASAQARWVIELVEPHLGVPGQGLEARASSSRPGARPRRPMPVSTSRWTPHLRSASVEAGERGDALDLPGVVDDRHEVVREELVEPVAAGAVVAAHHQDRDADAGGAELHRLLEEGDAEAGDAGALQRAGDGRGAVAVGVGLEHAPDLRPLCEAAGAHGRDSERSRTRRLWRRWARFTSRPGGADRIGRRRAAGAEHAHAPPDVVGGAQIGGGSRGRSSRAGTLKVG